jgi:hypothetical protein
MADETDSKIADTVVECETDPQMKALKDLKHELLAACADLGGVEPTDEEVTRIILHPEKDWHYDNETKCWTF